MGTADTTTRRLHFDLVADYWILQDALPPVARLINFLRVIVEKESKRICFVLDNFEVNLGCGSDGKQVLQSNVEDSLSYLLRSIAGSESGHRVIITSRYDVRMPELDDRLHLKPLGALSRADLRKKCCRLKAFRANSDVEAELQAQAKKRKALC